MPFGILPPLPEDLKEKLKEAGAMGGRERRTMMADAPASPSASSRWPRTTVTSATSGLTPDESTGETAVISSAT